MSTPLELLEEYYASADKRKAETFVSSEALRKKIDFICNCWNKAGIRFLMSCMLAKIDKPKIDIRKPYTEIDGDDAYSGRTYDEGYVQKLVYKYGLPCNQTTAYLTPGFRTHNRTLTPSLVIEGSPPQMYKTTLEILDEVHRKKEKPVNVLMEIIRQLIVIKNQNEAKIKEQLTALEQTSGTLPLSSEEIITLLFQHLKSPKSSRLPVLIVAAAYKAVSEKFGETLLPLQAHNAADKQTGSLGDVEITLVNDDKIVTSYEMKDKRVTKDDIDVAIKKLQGAKSKIDNYIFITTDTIEVEVLEYAKGLYEKTGIEFAILDCIGFIRHYLHFFHRTRITFLNIYQELILAEPTSSVSQPLKEVFLALRRAAEADR